MDNLRIDFHQVTAKSIQGWVSICPKYFPFQKPDFMKISFDLSHNKKTMNQAHMCVEIIGPREYLPEFSKPVCRVDKEHIVPNRTGVLRSINLSDKSSIIKGNGIQIKLIFDPDDNENFVTHLKPDDVAIIYMHLMWCSYVLAFIVIIILLYAVFHKNKDIVEI